MHLPLIKHNEKLLQQKDLLEHMFNVSLISFPIAITLKKTSICLKAFDWQCVFIIYKKNYKGQLSKQSKLTSYLAN